MLQKRRISKNGDFSGFSTFIEALNTYSLSLSTQSQFRHGILQTQSTRENNFVGSHIPKLRLLSCVIIATNERFAFFNNFFLKVVLDTINMFHFKKFRGVKLLFTKLLERVC